MNGCTGLNRNRFVQTFNIQSTKETLTKQIYVATENVLDCSLINKSNNFFFYKFNYISILFCTLQIFSKFILLQMMTGQHKYLFGSAQNN